MSESVVIVGVGLSKFGRQPGVSGRAMAVSAITAALADAGIAWPDVDVAFGGSDSAGLADTLVSELGFTGLPFTNVRNGCATGGSALFSAVNAVRAGSASIGLAVGCRVVRAVAKDTPLTFDDIEIPAGRVIDALYAEQEAMFAPAEAAL